MPQNSRYTKGELKGSGSFKSVYVAYDAQEGREVALNEVSLVGLDEQKRERIFREVQMLKSLHHKRILPIYDTWVTGTHLRFTTEMMSCNLNDFIRRAKRIKMKNVKKWARQILCGLVYLHGKKIIHRDLKCENIFIDSSNSSVKIGDFGLSISVQEQKFAVSLIGTPSFLSPEVCLEESYDEKVDIWSFGMCVLEMLTGQYPYAEFKSPLHVIRAIMDRKMPQAFLTITDPLCRRLIETCLQEAPQRPSAEELLEHDFFKENPEHDNITINYPDGDESFPWELEVHAQSQQVSTSVPPPQSVPQQQQQKQQPYEQEQHNVISFTSTSATDNKKPTDTPSKGPKKDSKPATIIVENIKDEVATLALFLNVKGQYKKIKINFNLESDTADQVSEDLREYFSLDKRQKATIQQAIYDTLAEIGGDFEESMNNNQQTHSLDEAYRQGKDGAPPTPGQQQQQNADQQRAPHSQTSNQQPPGTTSTQQQKTPAPSPSPPPSQQQYPHQLKRINSDSSSDTPFALRTHESHEFIRNSNSTAKSPEDPSDLQNHPVAISAARMTKRDYFTQMLHLDLIHRRELNELTERIRLLKEQKRDLKMRHNLARERLLEEFRNSQEEEEGHLFGGSPSHQRMVQQVQYIGSRNFFMQGDHLQHQAYRAANSPSALSNASSTTNNFATPSPQHQQQSSAQQRHPLPHHTPQSTPQPPPQQQNELNLFNSENGDSLPLGMSTHHSQNDLLTDYTSISMDSHNAHPTPQKSNSDPSLSMPELNFSDNDLDSLFTPQGADAQDANTLPESSKPIARLVRSNSGSQMPPLTVQHITPGTPLSVDYNIPFTDFSSAVSVREVSAKNSAHSLGMHHAELLEEDILDVMELTQLMQEGRFGNILQSSRSLSSILTPAGSGGGGGGTGGGRPAIGTQSMTTTPNHSNPSSATKNTTAASQDLLSDLFDKSMQELIAEQPVLQPSRRGGGKDA